MAELEIPMAELEELSLVPRGSKSLTSQNPPLVETISSSSSCPCSFMNDMNDDLLMDILLRLSDAPFAAQSGLVSKSWSSLIFSDEFRKRFNQNHRHHLSRYLDPSYSLPYTLLFTLHRRKTDDITFTSHALSSNAMPGIHYYPKSTGYLDFLPEIWPRSFIEVSSGGLLLSSFDGHSITKYCVSDPLTRQWNIFPEYTPPLNSGSVSGLWLDPNHYVSDRRLGNYKVVVIDLGFDNYFLGAGEYYMFKVLIFCSETGEWSSRFFRAPRAPAIADRDVCLDVAAIQSKGVLYFPLTVDGWRLIGFIALDPVGSSEVRVLNMPDDFGDGWMTQLLHRVGVGVVRGRLRLWQLLKKKGFRDLKVWELRDDNEATWVLVHDVSVKMNKKKAISVVAFDPIDGDVVFMVIDNFICKYNIREDKYEEVGQLPNIKRTLLERKYVLWNFMKVHTVVHTSWRVLPM